MGVWYEYQPRCEDSEEEYGYYAEICLLSVLVEQKGGFYKYVAIGYLHGAAWKRIRQGCSFNRLT